MTKHILKMELIGCNIEICKATNNDLVGIKGKIVDETKNTLTLRNEKNEIKKIIKNQITFIITKQDMRIKIDGKKINKKPEKRI
jgi:ribonuclease P protein subunit POP4